MSIAIHIALRVPVRTIVRRHSFDTIESHNEVVKRLGYAFVAKFGASGSGTRVGKLSDRIEGGHQTNLILVAKRLNQYHGYEAILTNVVLGRPTSEMLGAAPEYYNELDIEGRLWFRICSPFVPTKLERFRLLSNSRPLLDVLGETRTTSMLVSEANGESKA